MTDVKNPTEELSEWAGELPWKCTRCGYLWHRAEAKDLLERCPSCGAPKTEFVLVAED